MKTVRLICTRIFLLLVIFKPQSSIGQEPEDTESNTGFNKIRIENEDKLAIPLDKAEIVWRWLKQKYFLDQDGLKTVDPLFTSYYSVELFSDTYFDSPDFKLLSMQNGVRHRKRENLTNPENPKNGRELMQIKVNQISTNSLERGEYKFDIKYPTEYYNAEDSHPMIGIVKLSDRQEFKNQLEHLGLKPESMLPVITVNDLRRRIYIVKEGKPFISISMDSVTSQIWWAKVNFVELEPELNEITYTNSNDETKKYMREIGKKISRDIISQFPYIKQDLAPKYNKTFYGIEGKLPFLKQIVRWEIISYSNFLGIIFILLVFIAVLIMSIYYIIILRYRNRL